MDTSIKFILFTVWCSIFLPQSVHPQGYFYKHRDVNQYEIRNGKYRLIPTTTRPPTLIETFFPWSGNAYNSVRTPEEDAAILNSISDPDPSQSNTESSSSTESDSGIMSWFSMPSMPTMPSIPGFGSSTSGTANEAPSIPAPSGPHYPAPSINSIQMPVYGAASQNEPMVLPPPGAENQFGMFAPQPSPMQAPPSSQYPPSTQGQIPHEIRNNLGPTFQFHQQVKDSIPIPTPSLSGFAPPMLPYPYSSGGPPDFSKGTTEKSSSILDTISNYFTFGKRSDLDEELSEDGEQVVQARNMNSFEEYEDEEDENGYEVELKEAPVSEDDSASSSASASSSPSTDGKPFPCPKSGIWRWNGDVCIAVGPVPVWACRPNDLIVSGKIAICRNKIFFSPKVINAGKRAN